MKKIILLVLVIFSSLVAKDNKVQDNPFLNADTKIFGQYFLMHYSLPNFMGFYMRHGGSRLIELSDKQQSALEDKFVSMAKFIPKTVSELKELETKLVLEVINEGKGTKDVSETLNKIIDLKKKLTLLKIESLNLFKTTLTKEQYEKMIELSIEKRQK